MEDGYPKQVKEFERVVVKGEDAGVELSPDFIGEAEDAVRRIRFLSLRLGLPAPIPGQPMNYVLIAILERLADNIDLLITSQSGGPSVLGRYG